MRPRKVRAATRRHARPPQGRKRRLERQERPRSFKKAKEAEDKAEAAAKKSGDLLAKAEEAEKAAEATRVKASEERKKTEESEKAMRAIKREMEETKKEIDEKRKELDDLKKKIDLDRGEVDKRLKRIEDALKGALLDLKAKDPDTRIRAARGLQRLADLDLPEQFSRALCEVIALDPLPKVRLEALNALEKLNRDVYPHVLSLSLPPNVPTLLSYHDAGLALTRLRKKAGPAAPVLLAQIKQFYAAYQPKGDAIAAGLVSAHMGTITEIDPSNIEAIELIGRISADPRTPLAGFPLRHSAVVALRRMAESDAMNVKAILPFILARLTDKALTVQSAAIDAVASLGPDAKDAIPILRELRFHPDATLRMTILAAIKKIEGS
ncbi:MAG: hypothetical protein U0793_27415 [Gemmataceae bacterium]